MNTAIIGGITTTTTATTSTSGIVATTTTVVTTTATTTIAVNASYASRRRCTVVSSSTACTYRAVKILRVLRCVRYEKRVRVSTPMPVSPLPLRRVRLGQRHRRVPPRNPLLPRLNLRTQCVSVCLCVCVWKTGS